MPIKIRVTNLNKKRKIKLPLIRKACTSLLRKFKKTDTVIDITFITDKKIKVLNKKYMRRKRPTDVLSFVLRRPGASRSRALVGDVYISSDTAFHNAKRFGTSFQKELLLYTIHGVLHLLGFGDRTKREKAKMRKLEEKFLCQLIGQKCSVKAL